MSFASMKTLNLWLLLRSAAMQQHRFTLWTSAPRLCQYGRSEPRWRRGHRCELPSPLTDTSLIKYECGHHQCTSAGSYQHLHTADSTHAHRRKHEHTHTHSYTHRHTHTDTLRLSVCYTCRSLQDGMLSGGLKHFIISDRVGPHGTCSSLSSNIYWQSTIHTHTHTSRCVFPGKLELLRCCFVAPWKQSRAIVKTSSPPTRLSGNITHTLSFFSHLLNLMQKNKNQKKG